MPGARDRDINGSNTGQDKETTVTADTNNSIREMLQNKQFITAPGVFDLVSAKIADRTDAQALYMTGYGVVASYLGQPDAGLATYTDMLNRAEAIVDAIHKPLIADGDTGYGGRPTRPPPLRRLQN